MTSPEERRKAIEEAVRECIRVAKEWFGVRAAYLFGSLRGDSPWHEGSDVDLAVEGLAPRTTGRPGARWPNCSRQE